MTKRLIVGLVIGIMLQLMGMAGAFYCGYQYAEEHILNTMRNDVLSMEIGEVIIGTLDIDSEVEVMLTRTK